MQWRFQIEIGSDDRWSKSLKSTRGVQANTCGSYMSKAVIHKKIYILDFLVRRVIIQSHSTTKSFKKK
jgi:hypothetical protein